ncbi:hypothetical protein F5Y09DRAFT_296760 [Xylaria sp. FL1042]|nr:hypothetical protein F5Y09DRAFT_296760 [Xylaria sp. FL1042]
MQSQSLNQSRYFRNGIGGRPASQNRGRLSPFPSHPPRLPGAIAQLRRPMSPFHPRQQPHTFFANGPAATGYVPQKSVRYYRNSGLQQPIIPLREEFSQMSSVGGVDKSIDFHSLEQARPYSVPSHYRQTSQTRFEHSSQEIPRPASVTHTSTLTSLNHPIIQPLREDERSRVSPAMGSAPEDQCLKNDFIPPKRILPFPTKKQAKTESAHSETQRETITKSPSSQEVSTAPGQIDQSSTKKPQSKSKGKMSRENLDGATDGASASSPRVSKRPRITFTNWHSSRHEPNTSAPTFTNEHVNKSKSQESQPSRDLWENSQYGGLESVTDTVSASLTDAAPSLLSNVKSDTLTCTMPKRSASQATTVSATSTKLSCGVGGGDVSKPKDPFNRMSMIETTIVLQRDVTDIVSTRLQQGSADLLDVLGAEILMKMAMEDKEFYEVVRRIL